MMRTLWRISSMRTQIAGIAIAFGATGTLKS